VAGSVLDALGDDLNTPKAISELHQLAGAAKKGDEAAASALVSSCVFMGILSQTSPDAAKALSNSPEIGGDLETYIQAQIEKRMAARADKDWAESDRIRDDLLEKGIVLKDGPDGTSWEVK